MENYKQEIQLCRIFRWKDANSKNKWRKFNSANPIIKRSLSKKIFYKLDILWEAFGIGRLKK